MFEAMSMPASAKRSSMCTGLDTALNGSRSWTQDLNTLEFRQTECSRSK
jgi:hypothetical protein